MVPFNLETQRCYEQVAMSLPLPEATLYLETVTGITNRAAYNWALLLVNANPNSRLGESHVLQHSK